MFSAATKTDNVSSAANYIEDVFSTYLYTGADTSQTRIIQNNIALATGISFVVYENTYGGGLNSSFVAQSGDVIIFYALHSSGSTVTFTLNGVSQTAKTTRVDENGYWNGVYIETLTAGNNTFVSSGVSLGYTSAIVVRGASSVSVATNLATTGFADSFTTTSFSTTGFGLFLISDRDPNATPTISGSYQALNAQYTYFRSRFLAVNGNGSAVASQTCTGNATEWGSYCGIKIEGMGATVPVATGYGGLVWIKSRSAATNHALYDTARGATFDLVSNSTAAQTTQTTGLTSFNSNGFSIGLLAKLNTNAATYTSWTFREQAKFFDVVTYTGNGASSRTISHNLGSTPGFIIIKETSQADDWCCLARDSSGNYQYLYLNNTAATQGSSSVASTATSTTVDLGVIRTSGFGLNQINEGGFTYVMYLFAHNAGGFGATGTDNVITCGSYTGDGANPGPTITLGYEPQWVLIKNISVAGWDWYIGDNMRGIPFQSNAVSTAIQTLRPNLIDAEAGQLGMNLLPTGFQPTSVSAGINGSGNTYIYIAIRRGPMKTPTSGTSVFSPVLVSQTDIQQTSGGTFPPDFVFMNSTNGTGRTAYVNQIADRLRGLGVPSDTFSTSTDGLTLTTSDTTADDASNSYIQLKANGIDITRGSGWNATTFGNIIYYLMRRSPGFLDVVCYLGNGTARSVNHNLGVAPEFLMVKRRNSTGDWIGWTTYATPNQNAYYFGFNGNSPWRTLGDVYWGAAQFGTPNMTSTTFSLGTFADVNASGGTYVAYLFASVAGVSKVGTYTGNGSSQTINCGFANGARFILIKRLDIAGAWNVWDSARGIVPGNDPYFFLNNTAVQTTSNDSVDTDSSGFVVNQLAASDINVSSSPYFFLAIA